VDETARKGRRRKVTPEMIGEMRGLRKEGLTYKEIAERFDVAPMTVYNYLKKKERVGFFKRPNRKIVPIAIVTVAVSVACVGYYLLTRGGPKEVEFKTYTNENYSFKFDYPANWDFIEPPGFGAPMVAYFTARENTGGEGFIALCVFDKTGAENQLGISLDNLTSFISSLENRFENNENFVLRGKPTKIAIDNHYGVRYSVAAMKLTPVVIRFQLELVVKDNYFYYFEMMASEENYFTYEPIFEHVIDSFSFLD